MPASSPPLRRVAFVVNRAKPGAAALAAELAKIARARKVKVALTDQFPIPAGFLKNQDACCVLGGDGTILSVVGEAVAAKVPVFGINRGKLGFLATIPVSEAPAIFTRLLAGEYHLAQRTLLRARAGDGREALALNDIVLKHPSLSRLISLKVESDGKLVNEYHADGLIFSTPTGSTAYNLSAGGPLIHPHARVLALTPISPHTLTNRSVIFAENTQLEVRGLEPGIRPVVSCDGQPCFEGGDVWPIAIKLDERTLALLQPPGHSHFAILRDKLRWGEERGVNRK
jgi:NAD+ kinase